MKYTTHYNLNKPEGSDLFNVEHFNENSTTIDNTLFSLSQDITPMSGHISNQNNPHNVTKAQVGLGNVDNTSDANKPVSTAVQTELNKKANTASLSTVATTGSYNDLSGKPTLGTAAAKDVPASGDASSTQVVMGNDTRLSDSRPASDVYSWAKASTKPTYTASEVGAYTTTEVDNIVSGLESGLDWREAVATYSDIATTYPNPVDGWTVNVKDTDYTYRYDGSSWIVISANAIPNATTSVNGLMTTTQVTKLNDIESGAEVNVQADWNVTDTTSDAYINNKPTIPTIPGTATQSTDGLMSSSDKTKLDGIATGAEVNQNAFSNVLVGATTVAADAKTDTLELEAGSNITLTPDATNDKITIAATDTTYESKTAAQGGTAVSLVTTGEKYDWNSKANTSDIPGVMTGATSSTDGAQGLVPKPFIADATKVLFGNGTWGTPPAGVTQLSALSDVTVSSQTDGQALVWNATSQKWVNGNVSSSSTVLTATLAANATTVTFTGIPTTGNNLIDFYAEGGACYTAINTATSGQITLTYEAESSARTICCEIREV